MDTGIHNIQHLIIRKWYHIPVKWVTVLKIKIDQKKKKTENGKIENGNFETEKTKYSIVNPNQN